MQEIKTDEELESLPPGSVVYYMIYYDGCNHAVAEKSQDGKWYVGNQWEDWGEVMPPTPCYLVWKDYKYVVQ